jgi:hypothetical protein
VTSSPRARARRRLARAFALALVALGLAAGACLAETPVQEPLTIEGVVRGGWEIAGYVAVSDNRSLILFRHKELKYLVQCSVLVDVMRNPRLVTYCYELK